MAQIYQLDFFKDTEVAQLEARIDKVEKSSDRVRKGVFARHNELKKEIVELKEIVNILVKHLCVDVKE